MSDHLQAELDALEELAAQGHLTPEELQAARRRLVPSATGPAPPAASEPVAEPSLPEASPEVATPVGPEMDEPEEVAEARASSITQADEDPPSADLLPSDGPAPDGDPPGEADPPTHHDPPAAAPRRQARALAIITAAAAAALLIGLGLRLVEPRDGVEVVGAATATPDTSEITPSDDGDDALPRDTPTATTTPEPDRAPTPDEQAPVPYTSMPDVTGMDVADARSELLQAGLRNIVVRHAEDADVTAETVVRQTPAPESEATADQRVVLTVATAPAPEPTPTPEIVEHGVVVVQATHAQADAVAQMFDRWSAGINTGDHRQSFDQYTARLQNQVGLAAFADGNRSSGIERFDLESMSGGDPLAVRATFVSRQDARDGFDGQTCSIWRMEYELVSNGDRWLINRVREHTGGPDPC